MTLKKEGLLSTDDQEIRARILNSLKRSAVIEFPPDLRIVVSAGVVRLEGSVLLLAEKAMIEDAVRFTEGVLAVENALRIVPCSARRSA
ncbi:MAG: BON domain-containing protein [Candidatus Manganitrophus sp.]|nr:MAG: BON domain-containing protein [Candidatus Manganitrophus sp.]